LVRGGWNSREEKIFAYDIWGDYRENIASPHGKQRRTRKSKHQQQQHMNVVKNKFTCQHAEKLALKTKG